MGLNSLLGSSAEPKSLDESIILSQAKDGPYPLPLPV